MEKDYASQVYEDFLKTFRIALTNTSIYFPEHPLYIKAINDFKVIIAKTISLVNPITIGITQHSLVVGGKYLVDSSLTQSIAEFFHIRKIKNISLSEGLGFEELSAFLSFANLSPREITIRGGLSHMLEHKGITRITVSGLSYSQLLDGDGAEYKDLWLYLLREGLQENNSRQLQALANNFHKALRRLKLEDIVNDREIGSLIESFFAYLEKTDAQQFSKCTGDLAKAAFSVKSIGPAANLDIIRKLLAHFKADDLARIFLMQLQSNEKIDSLSFGLFSKLISNEEHIKVAASLARQLQADKEALANPQVILKLRELFSLPGEVPVTKTYRHHLDSLFGGLKLTTGLSFDSAALENNYRALLLGLFMLEKEPDAVMRLLDDIFEALEDAIRKKNTGFIKNFSEAFAQKTGQLVGQERLITDLRRKISSFAERLIFEEALPLKGWLSGMIMMPTHNRDYYLDKIFKEQKANAMSLELFFKFFADDVNVFYSYLDPYMTDIAFLKKIMSGLEKVDPRLSADILKHIYSVSNNYIKLEVLKQMRILSISDREFLFSILSGRDTFQRRQALEIVAEAPALRRPAAKLLLSVANPFGFRSLLILENLELASHVPFEEMREFLAVLARYRFFWNRRIREKAKEMLATFFSSHTQNNGSAL